MTSEPRGLTVAEVCRRLPCSQATFYRLWRAGELPCREILPRLGRRPRFRSDDLEAYLTGQKASAEIISSRYFGRVRRAKQARLERKAG